MIIKQRAKPGEVKSMDLVGSVEGSDVVIVDDMIDTAGTLCKAAGEIKKFGAREVYAFASHGLFERPLQTADCNQLKEVCVTNTIPLKTGALENEKLPPCLWRLCLETAFAESMKKSLYLRCLIIMESKSIVHASTLSCYTFGKNNTRELHYRTRYFFSNCSTGSGSSPS